MLTDHTEKMWEGFKRGAYIVIMAGCIFGSAYMIYAHRRVIGAILAGQPMPELPAGHPRIHACRKTGQAAESECPVSADVITEP